VNLRPTKLSEIIGQDNIKSIINILIKSRASNYFPHCLFQGFPGCGKTTFATAISNELRAKIYFANGGNIQKTKDILPYLVRLKYRDILFIDEIHRISKKVQESLFTVMEDFRYDIAKGAKSFNLEQFTLLGATTESGMLLKPFYDRFEHHFHLEYYNQDELMQIIYKNSVKLKCQITNDAMRVIAKLSRFTPRLANSFLLWCNDIIINEKKQVIDNNVVNTAMNLKKIDSNGLDASDRIYINALKGKNKPLGLSTIVGVTGLSKDTIEKQIEPYLMRLGMVEKTTKGRILT
jgi:Holliday junction DNA helicase RuvB